MADPKAKAIHQDFFDWLHQLYGDQVNDLAAYLDKAPADLSKDPYLGQLYQTFRAGVQLAPQNVNTLGNKLGAGLGQGKNTMRQNFPGAGYQGEPPAVGTQYSTPVQQYFGQLAEYLDYEVARGVYTSDQAKSFLDSAMTKANEMATTPASGVYNNGAGWVRQDAQGNEVPATGPGPEAVDVTKLPFFNDVTGSYNAVQAYKNAVGLAPGQAYAANDVSRFITDEYNKNQKIQRQPALDTARANILNMVGYQLPATPALENIDEQKVRAYLESQPSNIGKFMQDYMGTMLSDWSKANPNARQNWWDAVHAYGFGSQINARLQNAWILHQILDPITNQLQGEATSIMAGNAPAMSDMDMTVAAAAREKLNQVDADAAAARAEWDTEVAKGNIDPTTYSEQTPEQRMKTMEDPALKAMKNFNWYEKFIVKPPSERGFYSRTYRPPTRFNV